MAKFSVIDIMSEKSVGDRAAQSRNMPVPLDLIDADPKNHYSMPAIEELATNIEFVGLLQNPLLRQKDNGRYAITAGHRRIAALRLLAAESPEEWGAPVCTVIRTPDDVFAELQLLSANVHTRIPTDADRVYEAERTRELLLALKESGHKFGRRMRDEMAARMGTSPTNIARYEKISNSLEPELRAEFDAGNINVSAAYEMARLPKDEQAALAKQHKAKQPPTPKTALVAGGMEHGIQSAAKVEAKSEFREAERAHARVEEPMPISIHVTAAVFGRLTLGAAVVFEEPGGKKFEALLAQEVPDER